MYKLEISGNSVEELRLAVEKAYEELNADVEYEEEEEVKVPAKKVALNPVTREVQEVPVNEEEGDDADNDELDTDGVPWDARIHSSNLKKSKDGRWMKRRGVDASLYKEVTKELQDSMGRLNDTVEEPTPVVETPVTPAPVPAMPTPNAAPTGHTMETFKTSLPMILSTLITEKKIDQNYVNQLKTYFNGQELWNLDDANTQSLLDTFAESGLVEKA